MSRQTQISKFFKTKANVSSDNKINLSHNMSVKKTKRRSLSLNKSVTPSKSPKMCNDHYTPSINMKVECVYSDDSSDCVILNSSGEPVAYSLTPKSEHDRILEKTSNIESPSLLQIEKTQQVPVNIPSFQTPKKTRQNRRTVRSPNEDIWMTFESDISPQKSPGSKFKESSTGSPSTRKKFFSPNKKRSVNEPLRVKRSLTMEMGINPQSNGNEVFKNACQDMDDKTIFLLTIINNFLHNESLINLVDEESHTLLKSCLHMPKPAMRLICRLYWRKEGWYKKDKIKDIIVDGKNEIDDPTFHHALNMLGQSGFITVGKYDNMNIDDFISFLNRNDLMAVCKEMHLKCDSKQDAIAALKSFCNRRSNITNYFANSPSNNSERLLKVIGTKVGPCYKMSDLARNTFYKLYIIMYLGMDYNIIRNKKLEFTLINVKINREVFPIDRGMALDDASIVFKTKEDFERYLDAHQIYEKYLEISLKPKDNHVAIVNLIKHVYELYKNIGDVNMSCYTSLPAWLRRYTPANLYVKILEQSIQQLKKDKMGELCCLALNILATLIAQSGFRQHKKGEWYAEKSRILQSLHRDNEAAEVLLEGFKSNISEENKDSLRPRARLLVDRCAFPEHLEIQLTDFANKDAILENNLGGEHIYKQPMDRISQRGKIKFETRSHGGRVVHDAEEYCIVHYISKGDYTHGEHWEGRIVTTIFFLLFWEIIYRKPPSVSGVFLSYYQQFPLDLFTESFYENRRNLIDKRLLYIEMSNKTAMLGEMQEIWDGRPENELSGIDSTIGWQKVRAVAMCLGTKAVAAICRRLVTNYRYAHSGFPDLTLWHEGTEQIKFVEVKTDADKPSMKQIQWMGYLREHGIDTEFCYIGVNTTRQRCRTGNAPPKKRTLR